MHAELKVFVASPADLAATHVAHPALDDAVLAGMADAGAAAIARRQAAAFGELEQTARGRARCDDAAALEQDFSLAANVECGQHELFGRECAERALQVVAAHSLHQPGWTAKKRGAVGGIGNQGLELCGGKASAIAEAFAGKAEL